MTTPLATVAAAFAVNADPATAADAPMGTDDGATEGAAAAPFKTVDAAPSTPTDCIAAPVDGKAPDNVADDATGAVTDDPKEEEPAARAEVADADAVVNLERAAPAAETVEAAAAVAEDWAVAAAAVCCAAGMAVVGAAAGLAVGVVTTVAAARVAASDFTPMVFPTLVDSFATTFGK